MDIRFQGRTVTATREAREGDPDWAKDRDQIRVTFDNGDEATVDRAEYDKALQDDPRRNQPGPIEQRDRPVHRWGQNEYVHDKDGRDEASANGPARDAGERAKDATGRPVHGPATPLAAHEGDPSRKGE